MIYIVLIFSQIYISIRGFVGSKKGVGTKIAHKSIIGGVKKLAQFLTGDENARNEIRNFRAAHLLEKAERGNP